MKRLDRYDVALIRHLQRDGRMPVAKLAERVHLSESSCARRMRMLESSGLIAGYTALLDPSLSGYGVSVFVNVSLLRQERADLERFEAAVREVPQILECYLMTGQHDYTLLVSVNDMAGFERLHDTVLTRLPGVVSVHSSMAIRTVKREPPMPSEGLRIADVEV
ncbi:Lrp/AsnC family transcriptional regulator [Solimonas flava]|uniref:Lrp/AsnC family transcriptional regulator n=1 Tax=Solimonas flava TaxID=415849 RepID=UPI00048A381F|nr:Lrp/AsnC family transcriptional regulator [Solimonas flava]